MAELRATDFWLIRKIGNADRGGRDILAEMAAVVEGQIIEARKRLGDLSKNGGRSKVSGPLPFAVAKPGPASWNENDRRDHKPAGPFLDLGLVPV